MGGFANNAPIVTDGLVFYVDAGNGNSYPGSGGTWSDLVGGNDGSFDNMDDVNNPSNNYDSANGGSVVLDGVDEKVSTTFDADFFPLSICCWVNFDTISFSGNPRAIVDQSPGTQGFGFRMNNNGNIATFYFNNNNATNEKIIIANSLLSANTWHYVCVTYAATQVKGYADGNLSLSESVDLTNPKPITDNTNLLTIGGSPDNSNFSLPLAGKISNVKIYNKTLSGDEITQNYNALKNRFV